jgi:hypothetical protein
MHRAHARAGVSCQHLLRAAAKNCHKPSKSFPSCGIKLLSFDSIRKIDFCDATFGLVSRGAICYLGTTLRSEAPVRSAEMQHVAPRCPGADIANDRNARAGTSTWARAGRGARNCSIAGVRVAGNARMESA